MRSAKKLAQHPPIRHAPRQNSPCKPPIRHTPRQNSPSTATGGCPPRQNSPSAPQSGTHRDKTRPARQNSAVLAYFRSAGRKISRFLRRHSKQGEFSRADHHPLATLGTLTGTKLSPHAPTQAPTGTKLSRTAKNTQISPFEASREKIIPVETRSRHKQPTQGEFYPANHHTLATLGTLTGTKLSGHTACKASTGTKLSPHCPMGIPPPKSHAIPSAPEPTTTQNVGIPMIEFQSWKYSSGNCMRNCRASRKTAHKAGPVVIHRPRLVCISCISANASDYQARTER